MERLAPLDTDDGDPRAEQELFVRSHQAGLWRYLRCLGAQPAEADDLTQETLVAALGQAVLRFPTEQARAYLRAAARNGLRRRLRREGLTPIVDLDEAAAAHDRLLGSADEAERGDAVLTALDECLAGLPARTREVLRLRFEERCDRASIADRTGLGTLGVKSLLARSYAALRRCIRERLDRGVRDD